MKKKLLLLLSVITLMLTFAFAASAANCNSGGNVHGTFVKTEVVEPTCVEQGYTVYNCNVCGESYHDNFVDAKGHDWKGEYVNVGNYYANNRVCQRESCDGTANGYETENGAVVKYYSVQFINGQALDTSVSDVKYTTLAATTYNQGLQANYVKEGESVTYTGTKPYRYKDKVYGEYRFIGWTKDADLDTTTSVSVGSNENYKVTIENVTANANYYAAWEGVDTYYDIVVYNSDGYQLLYSQKIKHGSCIDYPYSYPPRESTTSVDFVFEGWEIGVKDAEGKTYNFYDKDEIHIKNVPIYSSHSIKAVHSTTARIYKIDFCDANWNLQRTVEVGFGQNLTQGGILDGITYSNYRDDTYIYEYKGYWETERGQKLYLNSFAVPAGLIDADDPIYLYDAEGNFLTTADGSKMEVEEIHTQYALEYFNTNVITYVFPVTEKGDYILDAKGNAVCLAVDSRGIFTTDTNGNRVAFSADDAESLRNIKVKPAFNRRLVDYPFVVEINIPDDELVPADYQAGLIVQVTNENGQLLDAGTTVYDSETGKSTCTLYVTKANMYNITVVSPNEKYVAQKAIVWEVFSVMNENIIIDLEKSDSYSDAVAPCRCICHNSFFRGIWVRVLNLLYNFFGVKYVCCYDMYATLGDLLAYTM